MNYIEWCEKVLLTLEHLSHQSHYIRNYGIDQDRLQGHVWGDKYEDIKKKSNHDNFYEVIDDAVYDLEKLGLIEDGINGFQKLTLFGREMALNPFSLWERICQNIGTLPFNHQAVLETLNRLSETESEDYAVARTISDHHLLSELREMNPASFTDFTEEDLWAVLRDLRSRRLIFAEDGDYIDETRACYRGLVWERKSQEVANVTALNRLVQHGESSGIEFKREIQLGTKDQIAEFVRDLLGLVNTHSMGERKMIIGFDDKTKEFYAPVNNSITRDRIEDVLANYTKPVVEIHYETISYGIRGNIGIIIVKRDPRLLPYKPAKSFGDKKRITDAQVFVRRNSHTHQAEPWEIAILEDEARQAKSSVERYKNNTD